jgi:hypothetical protein
VAYASCEYFNKFWSSCAPVADAALENVVPEPEPSPSPTPTPEEPTEELVGDFEQCGGDGYTGPTKCANPELVCVYDNQWWWQCDYPSRLVI